MPERRAELTTEGGLEIAGQKARVGEAVSRCRDAGIEVALFIDPDLAQVEASAELGAAAVEFHTGRYANAAPGRDRDRQLELLMAAAQATNAAGMELHAGHGLNYQNVGPVARLPKMEELNIGHSIVSRAVFVGLTQAVQEMKTRIASAISGSLFSHE